MIAKFPGTCKLCGNHVDPGTNVVWKPGEGIRHQPGQCPAPVAPAAPRPTLDIEDAGVYVLPDGSIVKVKANKAKTHTYAMRWTPINGERLAESGDHVHGEYVYEPRLVERVAVEGRKMTLAEAKAFILQFGVCCRCGRSLKVAESVERGIGPVCIKYFTAGTTGASLMIGGGV